MFAKRFTLVIVILTCVFSAGGQQPSTSDTQMGQVERIVTTTPGATLNQKLAFLAVNIDILQNRINKLEGRTVEDRTVELPRYQIAATTIRIEGGVYPQDFVQVFRMDTRTGYVCQVVGPQVVKGELYGTTLPYCTQQ
jgi:hypothetical protein